MSIRVSQKTLMHSIRVIRVKKISPLMSQTMTINGEIILKREKAFTLRHSSSQSPILWRCFQTPRCPARRHPTCSPRWNRGADGERFEDWWPCCEEQYMFLSLNMFWEEFMVFEHSVFFKIFRFWALLLFYNYFLSVHNIDSLCQAA